MNTKIISLSLPDYALHLLDQVAPKGERSEFITEAIVEKALDVKLQATTEQDPWQEILSHKHKRFATEHVLGVIRKMRDEE